MQDIVVRRPGGHQVVTGAERMTVRDLVARAGVTGEAFVSGSEVPLDPDATLADLDLGVNRTVVIARCRRVVVTVTFNGKDRTEAFSSGASVAALLAWASGPQGFDLPPGERPKHVLKSGDGTDELHPGDHVGELATDQCTLVLMLVPKIRFEG